MCPSGTELVETARRVVGDGRAALVGSEHNGVRVHMLFHYGAVDIDPQHLVVWILLSGKPDGQLPEWLAIEPGLAEQSDASRIDSQWLLQLRAEIVPRFTEANWPMPERIAVYADSSNRVETHGGWFYFK